MVVLTHEDGRAARSGGAVRRAGIGCAAAVLLMSGACAGPRPMEMETDPDTLSDLEFQAYLADAPLVTVAEAYRAMLILADGEDTSKTFDERREKLESRGIARAEWRLQPDYVIDKGSLAYMVWRICQMRGGVSMTLFGKRGLGDRRYALRELVYRGMLEDAVNYEYVSGGVIVALMARADTYMEEHKLYEAPPIELPPEPKPGEVPEWAKPEDGGQ